MSLLRSQSLSVAVATQQTAPTLQTPTQLSSPGEPRAYYPALDGMRAIAFLLVFCFHYLSLPWGWSGVELFFVLSGFLITGILYDSQDKPARFRNFYIRRTLRIFPLYYGAILLGLITALAMQRTLAPVAAAWPLFLGNWIEILNLHASPLLPAGSITGTVIQSLRPPHWALIFDHFWSLCVEEQYYLVWPAVVFFVRKRARLLPICLMLIVICPLARLLLMHSNPALYTSNELLYRATPLRLDAFMYGCLLALVRRGPALPWLKPALRLLLVAGALATVIFLGPTLLHPRAFRFYIYPGWRTTWGILLCDILSFLLLSEALQPASLVYRALTLRPLQWLGRISFGAYVYHYLFAPDLQLVGQMLHLGATLASVLALLITMAVSWFSFRYFESPFIRLKSRFAPGL